MHINSIERVKRHFTKRITELRDFSYRERLSLLNLDTLEYHRLSCDLTLYKVFNNLTPWSPSEYFNVSVPQYSYIPFHMCLICVSHCVEQIIFRMISLIDVSLLGIVYLVIWSIQTLLPPLNTILELLIYLHS